MLVLLSFLAYKLYYLTSQLRSIYPYLHSRIKLAIYSNFLLPENATQISVIPYKVLDAQAALTFTLQQSRHITQDT